MKKFIILLVLILVMVGGYIQYKNNSGKSEAAVSVSPSLSPLPNTVAPPSTDTASNIRTFTVIGRSFSFSPSQITVNKGDTVKIVFQDADGTHNLTIEGYNTGTDTIQTGQTQTTQFLADKTGTFAYYCSVGSHRQLGMVGTLIVK